MTIKPKLIALCLFVGAATFVNAQLSNDLILHYSFNNTNANDEVGNQDGVVNGPTPCADRFGNANMAYQFSNNSITHSVLTFNNLTEATVSFWLKPDVGTFIGGIANPVGCGVWGMYLNLFTSDGSVTSFMDGSSQNNFSTNISSPVPTNEWFHYVTTNDGATTRIYINGQLEVQYAETFLWINSSYNLNLGFRGYGNNAPTDYYNGKLDDLRIYGHAMDQSEIDSLYAEPNPTLLVAEHSIADQINVLPNPSEGLYFVDFTNVQTEISWKLCDYLGRIISTGNKKDKSIDLTKQADGIYYLILTDGVENLGTKLLNKTSFK